MSLDLNPPSAGLPCRYPTNGEWPSSPAEHRNGKAGKRKSGTARDMLVRSVVAVWMNMLIAAVVITSSRAPMPPPSSESSSC